MVLRKIVLVSLFMSFGCFYGASQQAAVKNVPIRYVSPADGGKMFVTYCAVCHGTDGRGSGPAASALKNVPTDLSVLTKQNNGKFPDLHVQQLIGDRSMIPSHGTKDMPSWGKLFDSLGSGHNMEEAEAHQRVVNLAKYVALLQR